MTRYELHVQEWHNCQRCHLSKVRTKIVLGRGVVPCDVLFVGEAPGESENLLGKPFVGPAGKLLDIIIEKGIGLNKQKKPLRRYALTNLVACIPREESGDKATEPSIEEIEACAPRLLDLIDLANPKVIVCVGSLSRDWLDQNTKTPLKLKNPVPMLYLVHPAAILRMNYAQQGLAVQRSIVNLRSGLEELLGEPI